MIHILSADNIICEEDIPREYHMVHNRRSQYTGLFVKHTFGDSGNHDQLSVEF